MKLSTSAGSLPELEGLLVLCRTQGGAPSALEAEADKALKGALSAACDRLRFRFIFVLKVLSNGVGNLGVLCLVDLGG